MKEIKSKSANEVLNESYVEISKYVAKTRAYTSMIDGFKAVYRRLLYASRNIKGKTKAMEFISAALVYHPHGDSGCAEALVSMTCQYNPLPLFKGYGNFGGCGFGPAAPRYLSAELNDIGRLMYLELADYADFEEGDAGEMEPKYLPALIPYSLIAGSKGMTVGLPTPNIPSFNLMDLINYFRGRLTGKLVSYPRPDVGKAHIYGHNVGDIGDLYHKGNCKVEYQAIINYDDPIIRIDSFPPNTKMWGMQDYLQSYIDQGIVEYSDITSKDGVAYQYELLDRNRLSIQKLISDFDYRSWSSESYRMLFEKDGNVYLCSFDKVVDECLSYLKKCAIRKFTHEIEILEKRMQVIEVLVKFKEKYKDSSLGEIKSKPASYYKNEMMSWGYTSEVASQAWSKSLTYITSDHDTEFNDMVKELEYYKKMQKDPTEYLVSLYDRLEELVKPLYDSRIHSDWYYPTESGSDLGYIWNKNNQIEIGKGRKFIKYSKYIYVLMKDGSVLKIEAPKILGATYKLPDEAIDIQGDFNKLKYLVLVAGTQYVTAFPLSRFTDEVNYVSKVTGSNEFTKLFAISKDRVIMKGKEFQTECSIDELIRDKDSNKRLIPIYWGSKSNIEEVIDRE